MFPPAQPEQARCLKEGKDGGLHAAAAATKAKGPGQQVVRDGGSEVDREPEFEVVAGDFVAVTDLSEV